MGHPCVMGRGREAVGQRLTSAVLRWRAAAGAAAGWALAAGLVHAWVGRWMTFFKIIVLYREPTARTASGDFAR